MDYGPVLAPFNKSKNIIRSLILEKIFTFNQRFQIWWLISGIEVMKKYKISTRCL